MEAMIGCSKEAIDRLIKETSFNDELLLLAMGMLSDAQEELVRGNGEKNRQMINRAKYVISKVHQDIRNGG